MGRAGAAGVAVVKANVDPNLDAVALEPKVSPVLDAVRPPRSRGVRNSQAPMDRAECYVVRPIGLVRSPLRAIADAPNHAFEEAPEALLEIDSSSPSRRIPPKRGRPCPS